MAEQQGWIAERRTVRPGLEALRMKHVVGPHGYRIDHVTYYIATEMRDWDGLPPVGTCDHSYPNGSGGTGFLEARRLGWHSLEPNPLLRLS